MNESIKISNKFKPLFQLLDKTKYPEVDTVIITGGRYSLKSYSVSILALVALVQFEWNILYTRFTNSTIVDSVKPEVSDKIDLLGYGDIVKDTESHIELNNNRISFKGIKPGQKSQTAKLKGFSGFNCFINDEAEELPDYKTFKKIFYSIRDTNKRNLSILILNPTTKEHWIFQEFFEKKGLEGGENCVVDNVMYIHSSYLDCDKNLMPKNILNDYERMKIENPTEYENIVMGGWITEQEGVLVPKSKLTFVEDVNLKDEDVQYRFAVGDPADTGGDKYSMPFMEVVFYQDKLLCYVKDVIHTGMGIEANTQRIVERVKDYRTQQVLIEANGVGLAAFLLLKQIIPEGREVIPFNSSVKKEIRIYSNYEFIPKHFIFSKKQYDENQEYRQFVDDLTNYQKDGDNKHRIDAIDAMCSAAKILKLKYKL